MDTKMLQGAVATARAERDAARRELAALQSDYNEAMTLVGKLAALVDAASGYDGRETALAAALLGVVPDGDAPLPFTEADAYHALTGDHMDATHAPGGLTPLSAESAATDSVAQTEINNEGQNGNKTMYDFMTMPMKDWPQPLQDYTIHVGKRVMASFGLFSDCVEQYIKAGYPDDPNGLIMVFDAILNRYNDIAQHEHD